MQKTDASGQLRLADLPLGIYEITVSFTGFKTLKLGRFRCANARPSEIATRIGSLNPDGRSREFFIKILSRAPLPRYWAEPSPAQSNITIRLTLATPMPFGDSFPTFVVCSELRPNKFLGTILKLVVAD